MQISFNSYNLFRVSTSTPFLKLADVDFNTEQIINISNLAVKHKSYVTLFPELNITGYSCGDLFFQDVLLNSVIKNLIKLKKHTKINNNLLIVGAPIEYSGKLFNCAVIISNGKILGIIPKTYLCNNSEYYEERWFSSEYDRINDFIKIDNEEIPFGADIIFEDAKNHNLKFSVEICEDLWALKPPSLDYASAGANVIFNLSASNEYISKLEYRKDIVRMQSGRCIAGYVYSSCGVGESTTDTIFSGHSMIAANGKVISQTDRFSFENQLIISDIDLDELNNDRIKNNSYGFSKTDKNYRIVPFNIDETSDNKILVNIKKNPFVPDNDNLKDEVCNEILNIQSNALIRRLKHINTDKCVIGISGGLDSTLALIAVFNAYNIMNLDAKNIFSISMPGFGTSNKTKTNAEKLCDLLGTQFIQIDIADSVKQHFKDINHNENNTDIVFENSQARERTQILMDYANKVGGIVIGTGDLSEIALGWATYNGDQMSMYGLNSGIPKTLIKYIIKWYAENNLNLKEVLYDILDTPISPELLPLSNDNQIKQETEKSIGSYELNDFFLYYAIRHHFNPRKILLYAEQVFEEYSEKQLIDALKNFYKRFISQQFKRSAMPDGVKIGTVALSPRADWRMPSDTVFNLWINEIEQIK